MEIGELIGLVDVFYWVGVDFCIYFDFFFFSVEGFVYCIQGFIYIFVMEAIIEF